MTGQLDRQSFLGAGSEAHLASIRVGTVGLGGGGSHVIQQLAHVGILHHALVDPDVIELSNLNRLVGGTLDDVRRKRPKVEIAARTIRGINPQADVQTFQAPWQEVAMNLRSCDIIIGGLDSVRAKDELDRFCRRHLIPYLDMGMDVHQVGTAYLIAGQVVLSSPGRPCLRCMGITSEASLATEARAYGAAGSRPQVVWPNGILASLAVGLAVQLVRPWHRRTIDCAYLEFDGNKHTVRPSPRLQALGERACPHHPLDETGDLRFDIRSVPEQRPTALKLVDLFRLKPPHRGREER